MNEEQKPQASEQAKQTNQPTQSSNPPIQKSKISETEEKILAFWEKNEIFKKITRKAITKRGVRLL